VEVSLFILFHSPHGPTKHISEADLQVLRRLLPRTPGLAEALIYAPAQEIALNPYSGDGGPPPLALQLDFTDIAALEAALAPRGHLQQLADPRQLPSLSDTHVEHQAMLKRSFRAPPQHLRTLATFLVAYPGGAPDFPAWLAHYLAGHIPIMLRFPNLQGLDVYTRIDWCSSMPWRRAEAMQRNKTVFTDTQALNESLASPVLDELRADVRRAPPAEGGSIHYPMNTQRLMPQR
jgi:hypothetical protein